MSYKEKVITMMVCIICTAYSLSCTSYRGKKFTSVDNGFKLEQGKSIAVFSGTNDDNSIHLAEMISERLAKEGKYKVITQSEISKKISRYPLNTNLVNFDNANDETLLHPPYVNENSKNNIDSFQKIIKADYILVVWISRTITSNNVTEREMIVISRLISYPMGNVVGYSNEKIGKHSVCCLMRVKWGDVFENATNRHVDEIIKIIN